MDINPLLIPILGISCGLLAIFGGVFVKPWFKLKEQRMAMEADIKTKGKICCFRMRFLY